MPIHDWTSVEAGIFHHFHHAWISAMSHALNDGVLPEDFYALAEQQTAGFGPDVLTLHGWGHGDAGSAGSVSPGGPALLAPPRARYTAESAAETLQRKTSSLVVRHVSGDSVVAIVEVLSPGNKSSLTAFQALIHKACDLRMAGVHLLILDLFPPTQRDPLGLHSALWREFDDEGSPFVPPAGEPLTLAAYQAEGKVRAFIEPAAVGTHLPDMPLFLDAGTHVLVPLEATYAAAFASVPQRWRGELLLVPRNGGGAP